MSEGKKIAYSFTGDSRVTYVLGKDMESVTPVMNGLVKEFVEHQ